MPSSVLCCCRKFVDEFHQLGLPLHVLVNNAGEHLKVMQGGEGASAGSVVTVVAGIVVHHTHTV